MEHMAWNARLWAVTSAAVVSGCSDATGSLRGGTLLLVDQPNPSCAIDAGSTWTALYACYFGTSGVANCSTLTQCHSTAQAPGGAEGFVCGSTQDACYQGFTHYLATVGIDAGPAENASAVVMALRTAGSGGTMPCASVVNGLCNSSASNAYSFTADDVARINAWIDAGAPNN
jgi:hypothetical protein